MSVTISSAVKNNLLALQTITSEASKSQNILATGKKVNSALDNATSFFTASSLNSRSNSLTNLLDSVSNGIQTIQAANTGISSITKLVDQLKSTAQQALQSSTAFTSQAKISSSSALGGATAADIRGTTGVAAAGTATSTNAISTLSTYSAASATSANNFPSSLTDTTAATVAGTSTAASYATDLTDGDTITVDDGSGVQTFTYQSSTPGAGEFTSLSDLNTLLSTAGIKVAFDNGGTGGTIQAKATDTSVATVSIGGTGGTALGLAASGNRVAGSSITISDGTNSKTATYDSTGLAAGSFSDVATLNSALSGATVGVTAALGGTGGNKLVLTGAGAANITVSGAGGTALGLNATAYNSTAASVLTVGDGTNSATFTFDTAATSGDALKFKDFADLKTKLAATTVKATADVVGSGAAAQLKLTANDNATTVTTSGTGATALGGLASIAPVPAPSTLDGKSLSFTLQGNTSGVPDISVTFGDPAVTAGTVKSLDDLNAKLSSAGISASLDAQGSLSFSTTSDTASKTFSISGTATGVGTSFSTVASSAATRGGAGANTRDALVTQYNGLLDQINTLAKDSSFNGLNLLTGDTLSLVFNETNSSKLSITGQDATFSGLGLSKVNASNLNDGNGINAVLTALEGSKTALSSLSGKLGANLAVVQTRQDFTKNLANTLTTGADNLVNADLNEEATKLLALQTSQSLAQSALSLANQAQQGVLRLLQ